MKVEPFLEYVTGIGIKYIERIEMTDQPSERTRIPSNYTPVFFVSSERVGVNGHIY